ncbi:MAG: ABC transporter ATP-binding protein [Bacteroidetes bacterium]|nr:MAG: ABC transporter ATP-binding protein [Bacteroidota bacterium]
MLILKSISTGYAKKQVLYELSLDVGKGEIVALIGPNGSGKSTILKSIIGLLKVWDGDIVFNKRSIKNNSTHKNIGLGISYCPQGKQIFDELSVKENLEISGFTMPKQQFKSKLDEIYHFFPTLQIRNNKLAGQLSGGEQQMLALARALIPNPKLLLLDEPSLGLAPNLVSMVFEKILQIRNESKMTILIVEQKVKEVLKLCDKVYGIKMGSVFFEDAPQNLVNDKERLKGLFL